MTPSGPPSILEIWKIARRTTDIIESEITSNVCVFGSAAVSLCADIDHAPKDVDIVVSEQSLDQEDIKETIADADSRYYLVPSKRGSFQKLYCRLPGWATDSTRCVKVDILVPPTLNLPTINGSETYRISDIPVMPIFDLLVMKTQGWWDDRNSNRPDLRAKERDNVSDIFALLDCATQGNVSYANEAKKYRHSREFMNHARTLVNKFVSAYDRPRQWRALGFPV